VVSPVVSAGTREYAFSSFAFLGEAEALEDARMFRGFFGESVALCSGNRLVGLEHIWGFVHANLSWIRLGYSCQCFAVLLRVSQC